MIFEKLSTLPKGTVIPKPRARSNFKFKGIGERRGERALIYLVPNRNTQSKPYQKGVTKSEVESAYAQLRATGELTRQWFDRHLQLCAAEGPCNFTTVGGLFELLGIARYDSAGKYVIVRGDDGREDLPM